MENHLTTDIGLATFLIVKGFEMVEIQNSSGRKTFVFENSPQLKGIIEAFNFGKKGVSEVMIDAREMLRVFRELKIKIHNLV